VVGFSGTLKLSFYRSAIKLVFEQGKLKAVETYQPEHNEDADALFPDLTFLRVLFGYQSFAALRQMFPDCFATNDKGQILVAVLFPQQFSSVWAVA
jgi:hypothetical protein